MSTNSCSARGHKISPRQIKAIHALTNKLGLEDEAYRDILKTRFGVTTCKLLSWKQAEELLETFDGGGPTRPARQPKKYTDMDHRPGFASGAQLRMIDALWNQVSRVEEGEARDKALNAFVNRICHVAGIRMLKAWQVEKIVKALQGMGAEIKPKEEVSPCSAV
jgi:hypothetical protein